MCRNLITNFISINIFLSLGSKMKVYCNNCEAVIHKSPKYIEKYNYSFCDMDCYLMYRRKHPEQFNHGVSKDMNAYRKISALAKLRN